MVRRNGMELNRAKVKTGFLEIVFKITIEGTNM